MGLRWASGQAPTFWGSTGKPLTKRVVAIRSAPKVRCAGPEARQGKRIDRSRASVSKDQPPNYAKDERRSDDPPNTKTGAVEAILH
jgi:hypothetical protein